MLCLPIFMMITWNTVNIARMMLSNEVMPLFFSSVSNSLFAQKRPSAHLHSLALPSARSSPCFFSPPSSPLVSLVSRFLWLSSSAQFHRAFCPGLRGCSVRHLANPASVSSRFKFRHLFPRNSIPLGVAFRLALQRSGVPSYPLRG